MPAQNAMNTKTQYFNVQLGNSCGLDYKRKKRKSSKMCSNAFDLQILMFDDDIEWQFDQNPTE